MSENIYSLNIDEAKKIVSSYFGSHEGFEFSPSAVKNNNVLVADGVSLIDCIALIRDKKTNCILQNSTQSLSDKLLNYKKITSDVSVYFDENIKFIGDKASVYKFNMSSDRETIIAELLKDVNLEQDMVKYQYVLQVANELVMNAQIDAPKVTNKKNDIGSVIIAEKNNEKGLLALSVIDYYGSLDCYKMVEHIYNAHKNGFRDSMSKNSVGAGLGSAMIYDYIDMLYIGVIPHEVSRVTAILPYGVSEKKSNQIQKSIQIIEG